MRQARCARPRDSITAVPGELGKRLYENVSKEAWQGWIKHQTMLINENRLNLADSDGAEVSCRADGDAFLRSWRGCRVGLRAA